MCKSCLSVLLAALLLAFSACACADGLPPLDMNSTAIAPAPKDECYLSDNEYKDDSIHVELSEGKYAGVHYTMAHVTISDPSQLRTIPAAQVNNPKAEFSVFSDKAAPAVRMAQSANAVIAINGDYITIPRICQIAMRQGQQIRNNGNGSFDPMYQVFCFGPAIVLDGRSTIPKDYENGYIISWEQTQRTAIAQIGPLEYAVITSDGDAVFHKAGLDLHSFSLLCEGIGYRFGPEGFKIVYNLDGGNSAALVFKRRDENGNLTYQKLNVPERERDLADMICFVSLVP